MEAAPAAREHRYATAWVTPVQDGPRYARAIGVRRLIGARLEPWAAHALFGRLPPGDGVPPPELKRLIGGEARLLRDTLRREREDGARFALFASWLARQAALLGGAQRAMPRPGQASANMLARSLSASPRALRRRFAREAGLSPKRWLRLHRLDGVLRDAALKEGKSSLADLAAAHGYADQAHLAREVARFTGASPSALRRRPVEAPPHLLPGD